MNIASWCRSKDGRLIKGALLAGRLGRAQIGQRAREAETGRARGRHARSSTAQRERRR